MKNILIGVSMRDLRRAAILAMFCIVCLNPAPALALAAIFTSAASPAAYLPLDSGSLVPIPAGYRAASRPFPLDPESETVVLFESEADPAAQLAAATPKAGRIIVEVIDLGDSARGDPAYLSRLEARLRKKAAARLGKITVGKIKDAPYPALSFREKDPYLVQVYMVTPKRLVIISAEFWSKAAAAIAAGYKDGH